MTVLIQLAFILLETFLCFSRMYLDASRFLLFWVLPEKGLGQIVYLGENSGKGLEIRHGRE